MQKEPLNSVIVYDDACPLCKTYTSAFVQTGLLKENNRLAFSNCVQNQFAFVDWQKAKNEIPLIDVQEQKVLYGIDAMIAVLFQHQKWMQNILHWQPIHWVLQKCYKFISFNRKIIVAKINEQPIRNDCTPDFHFAYRYIFILLCFASSFFLIFNATTLLQNEQKTNLLYVFLCSIFVAPFIFLRPKTKRAITEILGHCNLILLKTSFYAWLPTFFLKNFLAHSPVFFIAFASCIALFIMHQTIHRIRYIQSLH